MPFGMIMPGRSFTSESYRYGFNGKEKDDEVKGGSGTQYDYGFRIYDPKIAKFLSVDPLTKDFPFYTPYQFAGNKPIAFIDIDGLEEWYYGNGTKADEAGPYSDESRAELGLYSFDEVQRQQGVSSFPVAMNFKPENPATKIEESKNVEGSSRQALSDATNVVGVATATASFVGESAAKNGFWIGQTSKGNYAFYGTNFNGNQYVAKDSDKLFKLNKAVKIGGYVVTAIALTPDLIDMMNSEDPTVVESAQRNIQKQLVMVTIGALNPPVGLAVTIGDMIISTDDFQEEKESNIKKASQDHYSRGSYRAWKKTPARDGSQDKIEKAK